MLVKLADEIVNEQTYSFTDRGNRQVTIRTEMTPSVSRMVAGKRQELACIHCVGILSRIYGAMKGHSGRLVNFGS